jgi:hypothetical protein
VWATGEGHGAHRRGGRGDSGWGVRSFSPTPQGKVSCPRPKRETQPLPGRPINNLVHGMGAPPPAGPATACRAQTHPAANTHHPHLELNKCSQTKQPNFREVAALSFDGRHAIELPPAHLLVNHSAECVEGSSRHGQGRGLSATGPKGRRSHRRGRRARHLWATQAAASGDPGPQGGPCRHHTQEHAAQGSYHGNKHPRTACANAATAHNPTRQHVATAARTHARS